MVEELSSLDLEKRCVQNCPLCGMPHPLIYRGMVRQGNTDDVVICNDKGYSFCNCNNIYFTDWNNIDQTIYDEEYYERYEVKIDEKYEKLVRKYSDTYYPMFSKLNNKIAFLK